MIRFGGLIGLLLLAFAAPADASDPKAPVDVSIERKGESWSATFDLPRDAPAWAFIRSSPTADGGESWRGASWTVETPGAKLERRGRYDLLVAEQGTVSRRVRVRFVPFIRNLEADYAPALVLSDGTTALFDDHYAIFSLGSAADAEKLPVDLNGQPSEDSGTRVTFRDDQGEVMHGGRLLPQVTLQNTSSYVLFGRPRLVETEAMAAIFDPALPTWIVDALRGLTPGILNHHAALLGPAPDGRPTVLASWGGPTPGKASMYGSVVPGMIVMRFEGDGAVEELPALLDLARWFIAHEGAHFWLGQAVRYEASRDAWITEGGADLLAVRAVQSLDPAFDARRELDGWIAECVRLAEGRGVADAEERGEYRAYYSCGSVFALAAEAASGKPFAEFVRSLVDANREDGVLTRAEWLSALDAVSGDPALSAGITRLLDEGSSNPKADIAALFTRAGVAHRIDADGAIRLK